MKLAEQIPYYTPDGTSLGFRSRAAAERLIAGGLAKPSYGRKGHLKAIWLGREDGSNPIESRIRTGARYSVLQNLDRGRCWKFCRLDLKDEDGAVFSTRHAFTKVFADCEFPVRMHDCGRAG